MHMHVQAKVIKPAVPPPKAQDHPIPVVTEAPSTSGSLENLLKTLDLEYCGKVGASYFRNGVASLFSHDSFILTLFAYRNSSRPASPLIPSRW